MVFKQQVCGFDLLRVQEVSGKYILIYVCALVCVCSIISIVLMDFTNIQDCIFVCVYVPLQGDSLVSYVCDVNGWSFVKKSQKYYDDCAQILTEHMLAARKPLLLHGFSALNPLLTKVKDFVVDTPKRRRRQKTFSRSHSNTRSDPNDEQNSTAASTLENDAVTLAEGAAPVRQIPDMLIDDPGTASSVVSSKTDEDSTCSKNTGSKQGTRTHHEELLCVQVVVRHGDRTPKQKLKVKMSEPQLLNFFHNHADNCKKELKVKDKIPMTEFLQTIREMISQKIGLYNCYYSINGDVASTSKR